MTSSPPQFVRFGNEWVNPAHVQTVTEIIEPKRVELGLVSGRITTITGLPAEIVIERLTKSTVRHVPVENAKSLLERAAAEKRARRDEQLSDG